MMPLTNFEIPNGEFLFRYFNPSILPDGQLEIPIGIFNDIELSCDWERYQSNPLGSFQISEGKTKIVKILVCEEMKLPHNPKRKGQIVLDWKQDVLHDPVSETDDPRHGANFSHSLIKGKKKAPVCEILKECSTWFN